MAIELISCPACGTKNASHREVCLKCGANISTSSGGKATTESSFSEQLRHRLTAVAKINASATAGRLSGYVHAAAAIWSAGPVLFKFVARELGVRKIKTEGFLLFNGEVACYVLHLLDRTLSTTVSASSKARITNHLVLALCDGLHFVAHEVGHDAEFDAVLDEFTEMYNERQLEYGALKEGWFESVSLRFSLHAADAFRGALETSNDQDPIAWLCALRAPELFSELIPYLPIGIEE
jgi:hypothetical protein